MENQIKLTHVSIRVNIHFDKFTKNIESLLGRFDYEIYKKLEKDSHSDVEARIKEMAGEEGLMLFNIQEHGQLLHLEGHPQNAKQYVLGNPLIALQMTRHDIRAGLYAPLRIFVYEPQKGATQIEYDLPSSLFDQFHNEAVTKVAQSLDGKLERLIKKAS